MNLHKEEVDWHKIKFLESASNLKPLVKAQTGRMLSSSIARELAVCIQQGRLFYEAASKAPLEIRPLLLFYGMTGFAKALVISKSAKQSLSTLRASHGLSDKSDPTCRIEDLEIKVGNGGTFQYFNDAISKLNRFCYIDASFNLKACYLPSDVSANLVNLSISLKEIFSRIPKLNMLYRATFNERQKNIGLELRSSHHSPDYYELSIWSLKRYSGFEELKSIVGDMRNDFPFLKEWCFASAFHRDDRSLITYCNLECYDPDQLASPQLLQNEDGSIVLWNYESAAQRPKRSLENILPPGSGGYSTEMHIVAPIDGKFISEFSLHYMALFLLSSLVRYRPQIWGHAISRSSTSERPADDYVLALVEQFLEVASIDIPQMIIKVINPSEDVFTKLVLT